MTAPLEPTPTPREPEGPLGLDALDWGAAGAEAVQHLKALLRLDTTNPPGNERLATDYLADVLTREGIPFEIVERQPGRASLVACLRAAGSAEGGPLLLNAHLDVVPADGARWTHPPFAGVEADGCIWGRGALDMKHMAAMSLMALLLAKRQRLALRRDLIFAAVADEEAGCHEGSLFLAEEHPELVRAEYVLTEIGGYTLHFGGARFYPIQVSEKGICWFELAVSGESGHGSIPRRDNVVVRLARAIEKLATADFAQRNTPAVESFVRALAAGCGFPRKQLLPLLLSPTFSGRLLQLLQKQNATQAAALGALVKNTVSPTVLSSGEGTKVNVIPGEASVRVDGRVIPGCSLEEFLAEVRAAVGPDVELRVLDHHDGTAFSSETPLFETLTATLARRDPGAVPVPFMIPGFTDAFAYGKLGATCYGFAPVQLGPELDFPALFHGRDERIPRDGFVWGVQTLWEVVRDFCGPRSR